MYIHTFVLALQKLRACHSVDHLWNISGFQYIKLPEAIGAQDVRCILPTQKQLWVGAGNWIVLLEKETLSVKVCHTH